MKKLTAIALLLYYCTGAQVPSLLKDISTGYSSTTFGDFTTLPGDNILFLTTNTISAGSGLWVSDGSTAGTKQLRTLTAKTMFADLNGQKFFGAVGSNSVFCLWKTNGTLVGTDSVPLPGLFDITTLHTVNNRIVFFGQTTLGNIEVWTTDGSAAGTASVLSLTAAQGYTVLNNLLYFSGTTATEGQELYRSDGTVAGTFLLKDVRPGGGSAFTNNPVAGIYNNNVFLVMNDGTSGEELWKTDGTTAGTNMVKDIFQGSGGSGMYANSFMIGPGGVYFMANNQTNGTELWFSDGTGANTNIIKDMTPGTASSFINQMTFSGNNAYLIYNRVVWKTDGTSAGTSSLNVAQQAPGSAQHVIFEPRLFKYNNDLYFISFVNAPTMSPICDTIYLNKVDLSLTARTVSGKILHNYMTAGNSIFSQYPGSTTLIGPHFIVFYKGSNTNMAVFNVTTGQHKLYPHLSSNLLTVYPVTAQPVNNKVYLPFRPNGEGPGYLDLTNDSLYALTGPGIGFGCASPFSNPHAPHPSYNVLNKTYFFASESGYGMELYETDYTLAGTSRLKDINAGTADWDNSNTQNDCFYSRFVMHMNATNFYFGADDGTTGFELWSLYNKPGNPVDVAESVHSNCNFKIYPNPASQELNVNSEQQIIELSVYNSAGEKVMNLRPDKKSVLLNLNELAPGIYVIQLNFMGATGARKFVRE